MFLHFSFKHSMFSVNLSYTQGTPKIALKDVNQERL